ncbi:hypothetical protein, partial [Helicobacter rodentium]|uniref:hypothetical protein n=1 Tax=Helicobacter rodentium TaxID=59617 RepID=UPI0026F3A127
YRQCSHLVIARTCPKQSIILYKFNFTMESLINEIPHYRLPRSLATSRNDIKQPPIIANASEAIHNLV